jgi:hypothetical protein
MLTAKPIPRIQSLGSSWALRMLLLSEILAAIHSRCPPRLRIAFYARIAKFVVSRLNPPPKSCSRLHWRKDPCAHRPLFPGVAGGQGLGCGSSGFHGWPFPVMRVQLGNLHGSRAVPELVDLLLTASSCTSIRNGELGVRHFSVYRTFHIVIRFFDLILRLSVVRKESLEQQTQRRLQESSNISVLNC